MSPSHDETILSIPKLKAKGSRDERQIVLGWMIDTYLLLFHIPEDKFVAWMVDLETIIRDQRCSHADLDSLVGRLNHAAMVTPMARHFLGCLRRRRIDYDKPQTATLRLAKDKVKDLKLWQKIL